MKKKVPSKIVESPIDVRVEINELERIISLIEPDTGVEITFTSPNRDLSDDEAEKIALLVANYADILNEAVEEAIKNQERNHGNERP